MATMAPPLSPAQLERVQSIIAAHRDQPGALLPVLREVQNFLGHLPRPALEEVARGLETPVSKVYGVATWYSLLSVESRGAVTVRLCESAPCHVREVREVLAAVESELGIGPGETTPDGQFTLELVSCLGHCGQDPVIMVNNQVYEHVTPGRVPAILARYRRYPR